MDLVVLEGDVVLEDCVPLFQDDLVPLGASLKVENVKIASYIVTFPFDR